VKGKSFRCKAALAQRQSAKLWELRAATSFARLWRDQGKLAEARGLLAPVYGWFTEGFATPVLREAEALLDELGLGHTGDPRNGPPVPAVRGRDPAGAAPAAGCRARFRGRR
jgi:hypothetical protein